MNHTTIELNNISFNYFGKNQVFDNHTLYFNDDDGSEHSLYGIIGPSGTGKTTLINILGGQLKPDAGEVLIDGQNIYEIDDSARKKLIAIQMQTSTSLRGKLKYNLRFGLPGSYCDRNCKDDYLQELLVRVGLWDIFKDKEGLYTMIGEGGVNLSGGQRQRLNFAGLYLRARYYKPTLLLIDEPTSSLDEISEQAITDMIFELAHESLTFVVAHRLKTLDQSNTILDSSLFEQNQEMSFLNKVDLRKKSSYYKALLSGKATLD